MAGLGTQNQKSVAPLVRRVQLRSAYNFLCLLYAKWSTRNKNGPHGVSHSPPVIQFDGPNFLFNVTPQYKNQVKSMTRGPAIQEPKFSVCGIVFDGGCDGRGCGCHIFWPYSHSLIGLTRAPPGTGRYKNQNQIKRRVPGPHRLLSGHPINKIPGVSAWCN